MKELIDKFLMWLCFAGIGTIAVVAFVRVTLPVAATKARDAARRARKAGPAVVIPILCVAGLIVYGSTKNNSPTNEPPARTQMVSQTPVRGDLQIEKIVADALEAKPIQKTGIAAVQSLGETSEPTNALVRVEKWWRCGAYNDGHVLTFDEDWCLPYGTNHLTSVEIWASGAVYASMKAPTPIVELVTKLSVAPLDTEVYMGRTANNAYRIEWHGGHPNRDANQTADASIELFRNGNIVVTEGGVETLIPYEPPFEHIGYGQNDDWVRANFTSADEILSAGYTNWVDQTVASEAPNGLFCLIVTFAQDLPELIRLSVGDKVVAVTSSGSYPFVLNKGERHEIEMSFVPDGISFAYYDAFTGQGDMLRLNRSVMRISSARNIHTEITSSGDSPDVEIELPGSAHSRGYVTWYPFLSISPEHEMDPTFPILFNAFVDLPVGEHPNVRWTSNDGCISESGEWLHYDDSTTRREIFVIATYKGVELHGHISIRQVVDETRILLASPSVIVVEDPYTNRPNEFVVRTSNTVKMTASWELAQSGHLRQESIGEMPTQVCVSDGQSEVPSLPYEIGSFGAHENGALDFYLTSTNMNATGNVGNYRLKFIPDEGAECESAAEVRIVKIRVEAESNWPSNKVRHVFGPKELVHIRAVDSTASISLTGTLPNNGQIVTSTNDFRLFRHRCGSSHAASRAVSPLFMDIRALLLGHGICMLEQNSMTRLIIVSMLRNP